MATSASYKRVLTLIKRWPVDESKVGRNLGTFLLESYTNKLKEGTLNESPQYWDRQYIALNKITNNEHFKKYFRTVTSSATGLNSEQCNLALSSEYLEHLAKEETSFFRRRFKFSWS